MTDLKKHALTWRSLAIAGAEQIDELEKENRELGKRLTALESNAKPKRLIAAGMEEQGEPAFRADAALVTSSSPDEVATTVILKIPNCRTNDSFIRQIREAAVSCELVSVTVERGRYK